MKISPALLQTAPDLLQTRPVTGAQFDHIFHGLVNRAQEFTTEAHEMDARVQGYAEGKQDIAQIAPAMSHFLLKVEAAKAVTEGFINAWKTLQSTNA